MVVRVRGQACPLPWRQWKLTCQVTTTTAAAAATTTTLTTLVTKLYQHLIEKKPKHWNWGKELGFKEGNSQHLGEHRPIGRGSPYLSQGMAFNCICQTCFQIKELLIPPFYVSKAPYPLFQNSLNPQSTN